MLHVRRGMMNVGHLRKVSLSMMVTAVPLAILVSRDTSTRMGLIVFGVQMYAGVFGAFVLPRILRRIADRAEPSPETSRLEEFLAD
jgi:hypothetical protein